MARPLRLDYPGAVHHVTARGNERRPVFRSRTDRMAFLDRLAEACARANLIVHAYCLMGNHYHLLVEATEGNLSGAMHTLNGAYAQDFNRRHGRVGHLFHGRFASRLVEKERFLLAVSRYIMLNPVRAGLVEQPGDWPWSSYAATVGRDPKPPFLTVDWLLRQFGERDRQAAVDSFREFVATGTGGGEPLPEGWQARTILGGPCFARRFRHELRERGELAGLTRRERLVGRPSLAELLGSSEDKPTRNLAVRRAVVDHGYRAVDLARYLGLHESTISRILKSEQQDSRCDP